MFSPVIDHRAVLVNRGFVFALDICQKTLTCKQWCKTMLPIITVSISALSKFLWLGYRVYKSISTLVHRLPIAFVTLMV